MKTLKTILYIMLIMSSTVVITLFTLKQAEIPMKLVRDTIYIHHVDSVNIPVRVTYYQPDSTQCDDSPFMTADGSKITEQSYYTWCAVSRDLMYNYLNFGDTIIIESKGYVRKLIVKDNMSSRHTGMIDILIPPENYYQGYKAVINANMQLNMFYDGCKIIKIIRK